MTPEISKCRNGFDGMACTCAGAWQARRGEAGARNFAEVRVCSGPRICSGICSLASADGSTPFILQIVQPALAGLMDGSVSPLAPLFADAFATHISWNAFLRPRLLARASS